MKRATIAKHTLGNSSHLDIFFEINDSPLLFTYECSVLNQEKLFDGHSVTVFRKKDHRNIYLDFEGNLSENRGSVAILWKGLYDENFFDFKEEIIIKLVLKNIEYVKQ